MVWLLQSSGHTVLIEPLRAEALLVPGSLSYPPAPCPLPLGPCPFSLALSLGGALYPVYFSVPSYLPLSGLILSLADINLNSPNKGLLSDSMTDVPVDTAVAAQTPAVEGLTEAEEEELRAELTKVLSWVTSRGSL